MAVALVSLAGLAWVRAPKTGTTEGMVLDQMITTSFDVHDLCAGCGVFANSYGRLRDLG